MTDMGLVKLSITASGQSLSMSRAISTTTGTSRRFLARAVGPRVSPTPTGMPYLKQTSNARHSLSRPPVVMERTTASAPLRASRRSSVRPTSTLVFFWRAIFSSRSATVFMGTSSMSWTTRWQSSKPPTRSASLSTLWTNLYEAPTKTIFFRPTEPLFLA